MPRETLERIKAEIGSLQFSAQYQQSPVPPEGNLVKRRTGVWIFTLAIPFPASLPTGKSRISQVPWRSIP